MQMKVVGRRRFYPKKGATKEISDFLEMCLALRKEKLTGGIPRGVYKFTSFEEENEWTTRMLAGVTPYPAGPQQ